MAWSKGPPSFFTSQSMLADDGSFLWFCIPKNASRSLISALSSRAKTLKQLTAGAAPLDWLPTRPQPAFTFAFLRDPLERVASAWRNKVRTPPDTPAQADLFRMNPGVRAGMPLDEFVDWLAETLQTPGGYLDPHWRPQADFVCDRADRLCVDFIGAVETLEQDLARIASVTGPLGSAPHLNPTAGGGGAGEALSSRSRAVLERLFARDLELLAARPTDWPSLPSAR